MTVGPRTNNHVEGFHSKLNKYLKAPHPHIFKLINVYKRYEVTSNVHYLSILSSSGALRSSKSNFFFTKKIKKKNLNLVKFYLNYLL